MTTYNALTLDNLTSNNRVLRAILALRKRIVAMNGAGLNGQSLTEAEAQMSPLTQAEIRCYNDARAMAQANGTLTYEESNTIFTLLNASGWTEDADFAAKVVVLNLMSELLGVRR